MSIKQIFLDLLERQQMRSYDKVMQKQAKGYCIANGINPDIPQKDEENYFAFWHKLPYKTEPYSYRLYSHFMGTVPYIMSPVTSNYFIERYLNPRRYRLYYSDKVGYQQNYGKDHFPKTLMVRSNGVLHDGDNRPILHLSKEISKLSAEEIGEELKHYDRVCLKPSVDSEGGQGVEIFNKNGTDRFVNKDGNYLDGRLLSSYAKGFIIQEAISQHPFFLQFNPSSVNTLRVCTYRSVINEQTKVTAAVLRIGESGKNTDNFHTGGCIVGINLQTGQLLKTTLASDGTRHDVWNGIDFSKEDFLIPHWDEIIQFAIEMASRNQHMRLLAMDIYINSEGTPKLIEVNHSGFSLRIPYYFGNDPLAGESKEVIEYCLREQSMSRKHLKVIDL